MVDPRSVLVATGRRHPHEVFLLVFSIAGGLAFLLGSAPPSSLERALPAAVLYAWSWSLVLGGVLGLAGCYWRRNVELGLALERGGMMLATAAALLYTAVIVSLAWPQGVGAGIYIGSYGTACLVRTLQITRDLRRIEAMRRRA